MNIEKTPIDINRIIISVSILLAAIIVAVTLIYTKSPSNEALPEVEAVVDIELGDGPFQGDKEAPVQIVEYSDFQCPFCRVFWEETYSRLKSEYIDTGKVVLEYRDYPLDFHPAAIPSAQAARCANEQGKFWEMHDKMYFEQSELGDNTIQYGISELKLWGKEIGLNTDSFNTCLESDKYVDDINTDAASGEEYGVSGTPTFFINGIRLVGAQPFETFKNIIEAELK